MTEKQVQQKIKKFYESHGCTVIKMGNVYRNGFPDLMILRPDSLVEFIEVKAPGKKPTELQHHWIEKLRDMGFRAGWRDSAENLRFTECAVFIEPLR